MTFWLLIGVVCTMVECHEIPTGQQFENAIGCQMAADKQIKTTVMYFKLRCVAESTPN
jgi:hypothetical protein